MQCISMGSKVLMFNTDDLLKYIQNIPAMMEELKNQYRLKLPMAKDSTETFRDIYKKMSAVRSCDIKEDSSKALALSKANTEVKDETVTGLPTRDVRNMLNDCL